ncbi:Fe2+-dependent dioxygenase [Pseudanabaena sp. FACHB-2040]|uniref:Fe2+-dependent dioxygenase n=1 Tax=Pseudanabaena sp. FACHB-2040 TaxID=2692859 RepID=UPI0016882E30|nr:Fe2+-dependent dioxygenase [Pseudanabaena sp. FACHB-2040]MBD2257060.1 Fe2+-dependent dioxygenase [Pseudanabaena sp. FACHB-2040]
MIFKIPSLLTPEELEQITSKLAKSEFIDGKLTAGWHAKLVKNNQQLSRQDNTYEVLKSLLQTALERNPLFQVAVRPKVVHSVLFSRYTPGMAYGRHTDNALMGGSSFLRSDVSFTVFLNSPAAYEGGELVIEGADSETTYKLEAGTALFYPSTTLHRVDPVTSGERLVIVGWVESLVRDASQREILFDLETVRRSLFAQSGKSDEFDLLSKSVANLLRRWVE